MKLYRIAFRNKLDLIASEGTRLIMEDFVKTMNPLVGHALPKNFWHSKYFEVQDYNISYCISAKTGKDGGFGCTVGGYYSALRNGVTIEIQLGDLFDKIDYSRTFSLTRGVLRHEIQHYQDSNNNVKFPPKQYGARNRKRDYYDINTAKNTFLYMTDPSEIEPFVRGLMHLAKQVKKSFSMVLLAYIKSYFFGVKFFTEDSVTPIMRDIMENHPDIAQYPRDAFNMLMDKAQEIYGNVQ